jgi:hypothetical protein
LQDIQHQGRLPPSTAPLDWSLLRTCLRSKQWQPAAKGTLLQLYSGHLLTRTWAYERGYPVAPHCPCGQVDDPPHRLRGCTHTVEAKTPVTAEQLTTLLQRIPRPSPGIYPPSPFSLTGNPRRRQILHGILHGRFSVTAHVNMLTIPTLQ